MDAQTRMLKTLACLAVAMTATSALLGWIDPSEPLPADSLSSGELADLGQSLVVDGINLHEGRWNKIEIVAGHTSDTAAPYLTATSGSSTHFLVDLNGRPGRTPQWVRQAALNRDTHAVVIEVARRSDSSGMSRVQWQAVQSLVAALGTEVCRGGDCLPVVLQGAWAQAYDLEPGTQLDWTPLHAANN